MSHQPVRSLTLLTTTRSVPASAWVSLGQRLQSSVVTSVQRWAVESQRAACRNAMVAGTALAVRRAEREEVEEFFASREAPAPDAAGDAGHTAHG